ncbi:MAG TPA: hypothetical protein PKK12_11310 [Candidatus Aminicenantes bacterium]|nr:hypothetical protein [Candidatus Aminicenantes bacterium]
MTPTGGGKRRHGWPIALLLGFVLLSGGVLMLRPQSPSLDDLKKTVAALGKLPFKADVPVRYLTRREMEDYLLKLFAADYPAELAGREETFLEWMGFSGRIDLRKLRRQIILESVGGLYNEKSKELLCLEEYRTVDAVNTMALVHELRHAVLDQYFPLGRLLGEGSDFDDRRLAVLAAIEGDATHLMIAQTGFDPDIIIDSFNPEVLLSLAPQGSPSFADAPPILRRQLIMPYVAGLKFIHRAIAKKGKKVLDVFRRPPLSSKQILHPEAYFRDEQPPPVSIVCAPPGFVRYHEGVIGEYYLNTLLAPDAPDADPAQGWCNDRFEILRRGQATLLIWKSLWEDEKTAARVAADFRRAIERQFAVTFAPGTMGGQPFLAARGGAGYFLLKPDGRTIFYVRTDSREEMNRLIAAGDFR